VTFGHCSLIVSSKPFSRSIAVELPVRPLTMMMPTSSPPASSHKISADATPWP
jgi:hypothetical protein